MMRLLILLFVLQSGIACGKDISRQALRSGDLLFQNLDCGPLCDAIEAVTQGCKGQSFSHVGLVVRKGDSVFVIEALGSAVRYTPLSAFLNRNKNQIFVGRVHKQYADALPEVIAYAESKLGTPYDDEFIYDNGKYYCSELIYDAFKAAYRRDFFALEPMTFKQPGSNAFFEVWQKYYADLQKPIPEGAPGINPGGISRSSELSIFTLRRNEGY